LAPRLVVATGHSQSAIRLTVYHNRVHPITRLIDGFVIHGGGGSLADSVGSKVIKVNAETDLWADVTPEVDPAMTGDPG
jgi:fructose/tagatose bisphosphate aldolase